MRSLENKIKSFERYYGIHLRSFRRSRKLQAISILALVLFILIVYKFSIKHKNYELDKIDINRHLRSELDRFAQSFEAMNTVFRFPTDSFEDEHYFTPFAGNGYIGAALNSKTGLRGFHKKSLNLPLNYNPLTSASLENWDLSEALVIEITSGLVHQIQCYCNDDKDCVTVTKTLFAHRTRPSLMIEEIVLTNPKKENLAVDMLQVGSIQVENSKSRVESYNNQEFTVTNIIRDIKIDNREKHMCVSIASTKLPSIVELKAHDLNARFHVITIVRYSSLLVDSKAEHFQSVLKKLEDEVIAEYKGAVDTGVYKLKQEHVNAWKAVWNTGFGISKSFAANTLNGDNINATIYYVLSNHRNFANEIRFENTTDAEAFEKAAENQIDRCYEGFSTLQAAKLWISCRDEEEVASLSSLWYLTLLKNGCHNYLKLGIEGVVQGIVLSLGGLKFSNHHLELNLNPKQIHRNYYFKNINYSNFGIFNITVEVGEDNHAQIFVTMKQLVANKKFFACDAGCIDFPVDLIEKKTHEFPVKMTSPITAILFITDDESHAHELKQILHVHEVELAPPQDVNSVALHRHGHQFGGLSILFWTIFVFLIIVFHLFLCKLIYREMFRSSTESNDSEYMSKYNYRYLRTRAV